MTLSRGIDVSHHQGTVDWAALKRAHGITWGACKATEGLTFTDDQFTRNWAALKANGLVRIAYHFARPGSDATTQARRFLALVKPVKGDVICLDLEQSDGRSQAQVNAWAKEFGNTLRREAPGITSVLYLGGYAANGTGTGLSLYFDLWWYPRYSTMQPVTTWPATYAPRLAGNTTGWNAPHIWQWSASLRALPGLAVDANISPLTAAQISAGPAHLTADKPTEVDVLTDADKDDIANRVVDKLLSRRIMNNHNGKAASFAAYVVYGNEAAWKAASGTNAAIAAVKDATATAAQAAADAVRAQIASGVVTVDVNVKGNVQ